MVVGKVVVLHHSPLHILYLSLTTWNRQLVSDPRREQTLPRRLPPRLSVSAVVYLTPPSRLLHWSVLIPTTCLRRLVTRDRRYETKVRRRKIYRQRH